MSDRVMFNSKEIEYLDQKTEKFSSHFTHNNFNSYAYGRKIRELIKEVRELNRKLNKPYPD